MIGVSPSEDDTTHNIFNILWSRSLYLNPKVLSTHTSLYLSPQVVESTLLKIVQNFSISTKFAIPKSIGYRSWQFLNPQVIVMLSLPYTHLFIYHYTWVHRLLSHSHLKISFISCSLTTLLNSLGTTKMCTWWVTVVSWFAHQTWSKFCSSYNLQNFTYAGLLVILVATYSVWQLHLCCHLMLTWNCGVM